VILISCDQKKIELEYVPESSVSDFPHSADDGELYEFEESAAVNSDQNPEIYVQMGHVAGSFSYTNAVKFTPDGKFILTGSGDKTMILWNAETGREIKTFRDFGSDVVAIDVSPNGRYVVSADRGFSDNINLWNIATGKKIKTFYGHGNIEGATSVVFCHAGNRILSGGGEESLKLWDIHSGDLIREFWGTSQKDSLRIPHISSIVVTPDGKQAITGCRYNSSEELSSIDHTIRVWDINSGAEILAFNRGNGWVETLGITPDGKYVISGDWQQDSVRVWELITGKQISAFQTGGTSSIAISAGGKYALFGGCMNFSLWDLSAGQEIKRIDSNIEAWVQSIVFSPDGKYALLGDQRHEPKLWDLTSDTLVRSFGGSTQEIRALKLGTTGGVVLTALYNNTFNLWDYQAGTLKKTTNNSSLLASATMNTNGNLAITGGWDSSVRTSYIKFWDLTQSKAIRQINEKEERGYWVQSLTLTPDEKQILWTSGSDVILSEIETGYEIKRFALNGGEILKTAIDPGSKYLYASDGYHSNLIELSSGEVLKSFENCPGVFNTEGTRFVFIDLGINQKVTIKSLDLASLRETKLGDLNFEGITPETHFALNYMAYDDFSNSILCTGDKNIYQINLKSGRVTTEFSGHSKSITGLEISSDGKLVTSSQDGTTRSWDIESGKEIAQFIAFADGEWIVITPEGYFNASPNGARYLNVRVGNEGYSVDNFYEKFFNPAFVASALQSQNTEPVADIRTGILAPPKIKITSPETNSEFNTEELTLTISAEDVGGGIDEIRLYHNGKVVSEEKRGLKIVSRSTENSKSYTVTLVDGINIFKAIGFSSDRTESNPDEIRVKLIAPQKDVSMHVFTVGINNYKNPALNLNYAEPDARGIAGFFRQRGHGLFKNIDITDIYNEQATKAEILSNLKQLENTNPQDVVLIYLAGHGENLNDKWYFIPHELTYPEREENVKSEAISSDELSNYIKNIKAQKILVLLDACKSGAVLLAFRGFEDRKALAQLSRATGVHIVAASSKDQFATEVKELGHGIFTYTLLEGLQGKAVASGETITVRKLMSYIEEQLPELTRKYKQEAQYPVVDSKGMDFPLVLGK
jgi:WD40 repeat protein